MRTGAAAVPAPLMANPPRSSSLAVLTLSPETTRYAGCEYRQAYHELFRILVSPRGVEQMRNMDPWQECGAPAISALALARSLVAPAPARGLIWLPIERFTNEQRKSRGAACALRRCARYVICSGGNRQRRRPHRARGLAAGAADFDIVAVRTITKQF